MQKARKQNIPSNYKNVYLVVDDKKETAVKGHEKLQ